jgi:hypothetical protein
VTDRQIDFERNSLKFQDQYRIIKMKKENSLNSKFLFQIIDDETAANTQAILIFPKMNDLQVFHRES